MRANENITLMSAEDVAALLVAAQDQRREVSTSALLTLLRLRDPSAIPQLLAALALPQPHVRTTVALVLGELGDRRAVEPLIELLDTGYNGSFWDNERAMAAYALGCLGDPRAIEPLIAALSDHDWGTRGKAIEALGRLGDRRAVEPIIAVTRERQIPSGATILGNLGDRRAVAPLLEDLEALRQPGAESALFLNASYCYYAIRALGKLGDPRAIPLLEWISINETTPVLKGKSLADMAEKALKRIAEQAGDAE